MAMTEDTTRPPGPPPGWEPPQDEPGPGPRRTLAVVIAVGAVVLCLAAASSLVSLARTGVRTSSGQLRAAPVLVVDVDAGDVEVAGSERADVAFDERLRTAWRSPSTSRQLVGDELRFVARCRGLLSFGPCAASYRIEVPAGTRVRVRSGGGDVGASGLTTPVELRTGSGRVEASSVTGPVTAASDGGDIALADVSGDVNARTGSGKVTATRIGGVVDARSDGGDVTVGQTGGAVTASTGSGRVEVSAARGDVQASSDGGDVTVDGALVVTARSGSGRVTVRNARGTVTARSDGGDVGVSAVTGDVQASTGSGKVVVEGVTSNRIDAASDGGDVSVLAVGRAPGAVTATSGSGNVTVALPDAAYRVQAGTGSGRTDTSRVRQDPAAASTVTARSDGGDVTVTSTGP
jgi:DUF4097 and DUF4098 domain-containing protein YvlB